MNKCIATLSALASALVVVACGGNSSVQQGVFIDAPVQGLSYTTSSGLSGTTNSEGKYFYNPGDTVTFSLPGVTFPPVAARAQVSPVDLVGGTTPDHPGAVAIARLIQSLDTDNNPDNGITVDRAKLKPSATTPSNWSSISDVELGNLLTAGAGGLRSASQARTHLAGQLSALGGEPSMALVGRYTSGGTVSTPSLVAEIVSYHPGSKSLFVTVDTTAEPASFKRVDLSALGTTALSNPTTNTNLSVSSRYDVASNVNGDGFTAGGVQSLDISGNLLAIAVQAAVKTDPGVIAFYTLSSSGAPTFVKKVSVGSLPDGVGFSPDGKYLVVANEGELSQNFMDNGIDPDGSISIIEITAGVPADAAVTLGFSDFNTAGSRNSELPADVRIGRPGASVAQDLEPEYVSIAPDSRTAYVTLQENNAVAHVDLVTQRITKITALGFKNYGTQNKIATSDRYAGITATEYNNPNAPATLKHYNNLFGVYLPDGIASFSVGGKTYFITANEGDDRGDFLKDTSADTADFKTLSEVTTMVGGLDPTAFPANVVNTLKTEQELGRLTLLTKYGAGNYGDTDGDGDYDRLYVLGGRSFSIWAADTGNQVFDSGEDVERIVYNNADDEADATNRLALLKAAQLRGRLDNKGPEPESVVVGQVGDQTYAFVGLERASGILMYNISNPSKPKLVQYVRNTTNLTDGDISPEGLKFIPASQSPSGVPLLVVGYEVTGSVAIYQIKR
jgi:hypothetical protein